MKDQHKATLAGLIVGILIGLLIALVVSAYVNKVPVPFRDRATTRSAEQDAAEAEKNKDWNPNAPLHSKPRPATSSRNAAARAGEPAALKPLKPLVRPGSTDPLGDLAATRAAGPGNDQSYVIQVGAFQTPEDAESQRAKLSLMGLESKVSELEKGEKTLYRVRIGPLPDRTKAESVRKQLHSAGYETTLLRLQH